MPKRNILNSAAGPVTYIAPGTRIVGNVSGDGTYIFCGQVEGECNINGSLTIAAGCRCKGKIRATNIILAGFVEGDVIAKECVEIAETAHIIGNLSARSIAIAEGAVIEGDVGVSQTKESPKPKVAARLNPSRAVS